MSARSKLSSHWKDSIEPEPDRPDPAKDGDGGKDAATSNSRYVDAPEPDPWTLLIPLFPMGGTPFTPKSKCPHRGPIREGSSLCCMVCDKSGKDGTRALPVGVKPLPVDLEPADDPEPATATKADDRPNSQRLRGGIG